MGNWKWIAVSTAAVGLLVVGTIALGQSAGQQVQPSATPTAATVADRTDNCESWRVYSAMAGVDFPYNDEDECRAAVRDDASIFTAPPTDDEWDDVAG